MYDKIHEGYVHITCWNVPDLTFLHPGNFVMELWKKKKENVLSVLLLYVCPRSDSSPISASATTFRTVRLKFCVHAYAACRHHSVSASHSQVKINREWGSNRDQAEWRIEWESDLLDIYGETRVNAKLDWTYCNRAVLSFLCDMLGNISLFITAIVLLLVC